MKEPFIRHIIDGVEVYTIDSWLERWPHLRIGFSGKGGGVSEGDFASMNCGLHVADDPRYVIENRRRLASAANFSFDAWTCAEQVHDNRAAIITARERGAGRSIQDEAIPGTDAMITHVRDVLLTSFYADCVPLIYYEPVQQVIGLAHAGWKGTARGIAAQTIQSMVREMGCSLEQIHVAIGPAIGGCCYRVDERVIKAMLDAGAESGWNAVSEDQFLLDLKEVNRQILIKEGIMPTHIEITSLCTCCCVESFFSYRRDGGRTGRMASWIGMI